MILKFIDLLLGSAGQYIQDIYTNHLLLVNGIVIVYAIMIAIAHNNLRKTVVEIEKLALSIAGNAKLKEMDFDSLFLQTKSEWLKASSGKKVLISSYRDFWFDWVDQSNLFDLLDLSPNYLKVALYKRTEKRDKAFFSSQVFLTIEQYRGNLLKGIRVKPEGRSIRTKVENSQVTLGKKS